MPIDATCPHCGRVYHLKDELAGKRFRCSDCREVVTAPVAPQQNRPTAPPATRSAGSAPPAAASRRDSSPLTARSRPAKESTPAPRRKSTTGHSGSRSADEQPVFDLTGDDSLYRQRPADSSATADDDLWADPYDTADAYAEADPYADADSYDSPPPRKSTGSRNSTRSKSSRSRSPSRRSSGSGWAFGFNPGRLNLILAILGFAFLMLGVNEMRLSSRSSSVPTDTSLQDLVQNGSGASIYLTVSGVQPVSDEFVYEERGRGRKYYSKVYIPCRPAGQTGVPRMPFVLFSTSAKDDFAVTQLMRQRTHTGMIINTIRRLGKEERKLLQSALPGGNLDAALIFEVGRKPSGAIKYLAFMLGGFGMFAAGMALIFVRRT